jgi:hypothetical protein
MKYTKWFLNIKLNSMMLNHAGNIISIFIAARAVIES